MVEILDQNSNAKDISKALTVLGKDLKIVCHRDCDEFLFLEACLIIMLEGRPDKQHLKVDMHQFLATFPDFYDSSIGDVERSALLHYRNMMMYALEVVPAVNNNGHLLDLVTRLAEGKSVRHIPGGGATLKTKNRIDIYLKVGDIKSSKTKRIPGPKYSFHSQYFLHYNTFVSLRISF